MNAKTTADSHSITTELVLPNDTNGLGNMMGGRLLHLMDKCASISAQRHAGMVCVTASVDNVEFSAPIRQNDVVVIESQVNRAFHTSMEVELNVWAENPQANTRRKCNRAYYTFVALSDEGDPTEVPPLRPETPDERKRYEGAAKRRELRLLLSGRLDLEEASHIQDDLIAALQSRRSGAE